MTELRKDNVVEIFWGVLGIFLGSVIPALERVSKIGNPKATVELIDMAVLLICGVSFVVTLVMAFFWYQRSGKATSLEDGGGQGGSQHPSCPLGKPNPLMAE